MNDFLKRLTAIEFRFEEVKILIVDPDIISDIERYIKLNKEYKELEEIVLFAKKYRTTIENIQNTKELLKEETDSEMREMAEAEIVDWEMQLPHIEEELKMLLIPKDPEDDKNAIMELRAGTGGDEACIFVEDIFRMYTMFFKEKGWNYEILNTSF